MASLLNVYSGYWDEKIRFLAADAIQGLVKFDPLHFVNVSILEKCCERTDSLRKFSAFQLRDLLQRLKIRFTTLLYSTTSDPYSLPDVTVSSELSISTSYSSISDSLQSSSSSDVTASSTTTAILFCYFDPKTSKRQYFSIPEKIVYYAAKNATSLAMFQKLLHTCKYFFIVNPVVIVPMLTCYSGIWEACYYGGKKCFQFKDSQTFNFKIWTPHYFTNLHCNVSQIFPWIYKNDANIIQFGPNMPCLTFDEFMYIAGNAKMLRMFSGSVKYSNGENVLLEDIVKNLPKLKSLHLTCTFDESNVTKRTASKLMEIQHFKQMSHITLNSIPETLDIGTMFDFIMENKHIKIELFYHRQVSNPCKELIQEYNNRLQNENGYDSIIKYCNIIYSNNRYIYFEELMFPWNEKNEKWEFLWDKE
uniref:Uncharacterized protein n=1 Tax=Panagrolaimus sp. PS1159 TaxID=55785 RepID=A0AC35GL93_9BILA